MTRLVRMGFVPLIVVGAGLLVVLTGSTVVRAHASLVSSEPVADARLRQAPAIMKLYFSQGLQPSGSFVQITDSRSSQLPVKAEFDPADRKLMTVALPSLVPDVYSVRWQSLSADDDDYDDGNFSFTVLQPDGSLPPAAGGGGESTASTGSGSGGDSLLPVVLAVIAAVALVGGTAFLIVRPKRS